MVTSAVMSAASVWSSTVTASAVAPDPCTTCADAGPAQAATRATTATNLPSCDLIAFSLLTSHFSLLTSHFFCSHISAFTVGFTLYFSTVHSSLGWPSIEMSILWGSSTPSTFL